MKGYSGDIIYSSEIGNLRMLHITDIPPAELRDRHRLSSKQVNDLLGAIVLDESLVEKADLLTKAGVFLEASTLLRDEGIEFIPLKGPLLSYKLYGDVTVRKYGDIDLLVDSGAVGKARECLLRGGYIESEPTWPTTARGRRKVLKYGHHIIFRDEAEDVIIELHWRLLNRQWLKFRSDRILLDGNLETIHFQGLEYTVLKPEAELLYLVLHGSAHRWGMLKWLADIKQYTQAVAFDHERFYKLTTRMGCGRMVTLCNRLMAGCFRDAEMLPYESRLPGYIVLEAEKEMRKEVYVPPGTLREIVQHLPYSLFIYPGIKYKFRLLGMIAANSVFNGRLKQLID